MEGVIAHTSLDNLVLMLQTYLFGFKGSHQQTNLIFDHAHTQQGGGKGRRLVITPP